MKGFDMDRILELSGVPSEVESIREDIEEASGNKLVTAIFKKFPPDSKKKIGGKHKVMLTGNAAKAIGADNYSSVFLQDLSVEELSKLAKLFNISESEAGPELEEGFNRMGSALFAAIKKMQNELKNAEQSLKHLYPKMDPNRSTAQSHAYNVGTALNLVQTEANEWAGNRVYEIFGLK
jgi:hypothetical protein